ncbi:MAG: hypothetical protein HY557_01245 [Euryarchaeota archaeon]|nr:hypothetical protein [Euryarchaeota archaeon]
MARAGSASWGPFAFLAGALAVCCGGLPLVALALVAGGGAAALLAGLLWIGIGGAVMAAGFGFYYVTRRTGHRR